MLHLREAVGAGGLGVAALAWVLPAVVPALCHSPLLAKFCCLAGVQAAALIFLFLTMLLCWASSLQMRRHEVAWAHWEVPRCPSPGAPPVRYGGCIVSRLSLVSPSLCQPEPGALSSRMR